MANSSVVNPQSDGLSPAQSTSCKVIGNFGSLLDPLLQRLPNSLLVAARLAGFDKSHTTRTVADVRVSSRFATCPACRSKNHIIECRSVEVGEGLQESLGVTAWNPTSGSTGVVQIGGYRLPLVNLNRLTGPAHDQLVRILLSPSQGSFSAVDLERQIVQAPVTDLAERDHPELVFAERDDGVTIVIQLPLLLIDPHVGRDFGRRKTGHIANQVESVSSHITERA